jgi:hypothetical protein
MKGVNQMKYNKLNLYKGKPGTPGGYAHIVDESGGTVKFVLADKDKSGKVRFSKTQGAFSMPEDDFLNLFEPCKEQTMLCIDI